MPRIRRKTRSDEFTSAAEQAIELADQHARISDQIRHLEAYIASLPSEHAERELDRLETIPPPEDHPSTVEEPSFVHPVTGLAEPPRMIRAHEAAIRAERRKNMLVFFLSVALFSAFVWWLSTTL